MLCKKRKESGVTLFSRCFGTETKEETRLNGRQDKQFRANERKQYSTQAVKSVSAIKALAPIRGLAKRYTPLLRDSILSTGN